MKNSIREALLQAGVKNPSTLGDTEDLKIKASHTKQQHLTLGERFYLSKTIHNQQSLVMPIYKQIK